MEDTFKRYEQIDAYLEGSLSEQERRAFEQTMATDDSLRALVDKQREAHEWLFAMKLSAVKSKMKEDFQQGVPDRVARWQQVKKLGMLTLALLVLSGTVYYFFPKKNKTVSISSSEISTQVSSPAPVSEGEESPLPDQHKRSVVKSSAMPLASELNTATTEKDSGNSATTITRPPDSAAKTDVANESPDSDKLPVTPACLRKNILQQVDVFQGCAGKTESYIRLSEAWEPTSEFRLNQGRYTAQRSFYRVPEGQHILVVRDSKGCLDSATVWVREKKCEAPVQTYAFRPATEMLELPIQDGQHYRVLTKNGKEVAKGTLIQGQLQWNGQDFSGQILEAGLYIVQVFGENSNQVISTYHVTIVP
ncbi:MAG: hypothetical protein MUF42_09080 [Cytophagaceae bacterium]|nr:hypothetical protein [Cytophagaceae bacterium]